jgi:hypothetical protein
MVVMQAAVLLSTQPARADIREAGYFPQQKPAADDKRPELALSPFWGPSIQSWAGYIAALSEAYGFHPDFIAAVMEHETDGENRTAGGRKTVGLMTVMGSGPDWQSSSEELLAPIANLRWGMAVLAYVVQRSGGDLYTALAAYNGGWEHVDGRAPREYAARVLDSYGRALIARTGMSPDIASRWTVAVEIRAGNVPFETPLVLGNRPIAGLRTFAEHTIYAFAEDSSRAYYVRGYVVPIGLSELLPGDQQVYSAQELEAPLRARLGEKSARGAAGVSRVLLACLPSINRLRGQVTTRWYSPSYCPAAER